MTVKRHQQLFVFCSCESIFRTVLFLSIECDLKIDVPIFDGGGRRIVGELVVDKAIDYRSLPGRELTANDSDNHDTFSVNFHGSRGLRQSSAVIDCSTLPQAKLRHKSLLEHAVGKIIV